MTSLARQRGHRRDKRARRVSPDQPPNADPEQLNAGSRALSTPPHSHDEISVQRLGDEDSAVPWRELAATRLTYRGPLQERGIGPPEATLPACSVWETMVRLASTSSALHIEFTAQDRVLTASQETDGAQLWREDVFEVFLWPDETIPAYFEYEISPLGAELPLMVINTGRSFHGWRPWPYDEATRVRKTVTIEAEGSTTPPRSGQLIDGWRAEVSIPYALLKPVGHRAPEPGDRWRANFYRIDYDDGLPRVWAWRPTMRNFHEPDRFGTLVFG